VTAFKHILFPVDFSEPCIAFLPFVKRMADRFGARATALHAINETAMPIGPNVGMVQAPEDYQTVREAIVERLKALSGPVSPGITGVCEPGDSASVVREYVQSHGVDLIMMPTHGYGSFRRLLLGSLTAKVLHDVECPVWTAAHTDDPRLLAHTDCKSVVCAVEHNEEGLDVLKRATDLAQTLGASLCLLHAAPVMDGIIFADDDPREVRNVRRGEIAKMQRDAGTAFEAIVESKEIGELVHQVATSRNADLVVIGRGKLQKGFGRLLTRAYDIVRESPCPVLSL